MSRKGQIFAISMMVFLTISSTFEFSIIAYANSSEVSVSHDGTVIISEEAIKLDGSKEEEKEVKDQVLSNKNDLYFDALKQSNKESYTTYEVTMGAIEIKDPVPASLFFPNNQIISVPIEYGTVVYEETLVEKGAMVKKGTPLVKIKTSIDEVTLKEQAINLERLTQVYQRYVTNQSKGLKGQKEALASITDEIDRKIANMEYEKAKFLYESTKKSYERQITTLKKDINKSKSIKNTTEILAPSDGYVTNITSFVPGEKIDHTRPLVNIVDPSTILFLVRDRYMTYQHNMNVTLKINPKNGVSDQTYTGKVISSMPYVSQSGESYGKCYIQADENIEFDEVIGQVIEATIDVCNMDNVLVVPIEALTSQYEIDNTKIAVSNELKNGALIEREFIIGLQNDQFCQVITGLDEGAKLVKQ